MPIDIKNIYLKSAIKRRNNEVAFDLIKQYGVNQKIGKDGTPLVLACLHDNTKVANYCIKNGAEVNAVDGDKFTTLLYASDNGNFPLVKSLVKKGAKINAKNKYEMTPIMMVISRHSDQPDLVEYLLKNGADPFINVEHSKNHPNKIANNAYELAKYLKKKEVLLLIKKYCGRSGRSKKS